MKAIQLTTPVQVGDLDDGTDTYTHVRVIAITGWTLEGNYMTVTVAQGYVDAEGKWHLGTVTGKRGFEIVGDDYADVVAAASTEAGQKHMEGFIAQILAELIEDEFYAGTVVDI